MRTFIYVRPNTFIIYDIVDVPKERYKELDVKWLLHSINEPKVFGDIIRREEGKTTYKGNEFIIDHNTGELLGIVFIPSEGNAIIHKVGGPGHEFDVRGVNYAPSRRDEEAGSWRIELEDKDKKDTYRFLVVLYVRGRGSKATVNATLIKDNNVLGIKINERSNKVVYVLFAYNGLNASITLKLNHICEALTNKRFFMRLTPTKYYADINFTMYDVLVLKEVPIDVVSVNGDVSLRVISFSKENVTFTLMGKGRASLKVNSLDASARYMLYVKKGGKDILIGDYLADEKGSLSLDLNVKGVTEYLLIKAK